MDVVFFYFFNVFNKVFYGFFYREGEKRGLEMVVIEYGELSVLICYFVILGMIFSCIW